MEKRGIRTERGDLNREIEVTNQKLRQLKARISKLQDWLKEEAENTEPPTLADYIQGILSRKAHTGKPGYSQSLYNLKDAAKMLNFLQTNNIMDMTGLDEKFKGMCADWAIHDSENDKGQRNLHIHVLLTMRPLTENGEWGAKQKKIYDLDENGEKIPVIDKKTGQQKVDKEDRQL